LEVPNFASAPKLPHEYFTQFDVTWPDIKNKLADVISSSSRERFLVAYKAIEFINELLLAFKFVRLGHLDGHGVRTIGIGDTLYQGYRNDSDKVLLDNFGFKFWGEGLDDPRGTTSLAVPHIGTNTLPVARRYVRCFELLEHGFYSESLIVAFSILDDEVQKMLDSLLEKRGLKSIKERDDLIRGIKDRRLYVYLGAMLQLCAGKDLKTLWKDSEKAMEWLNKKRNNIAHGGERIGYSIAAQAIFVCIKTLVTLDQAELGDFGFPLEMVKHAYMTAARTDAAPPWVHTEESISKFLPVGHHNPIDGDLSAEPC